MVKLYDLITWHNNTTPAINETNLNAMSNALNDIDDRVIDIADLIVTVVPQVQALLDDAEQLVEDCEEHAEDSEAWAVGERGGTPVSSGDETYDNNSKYYAGLSHNYWDLVDAAVSMVTPTVNMNFITGELEITGTSLVFSINDTTGDLEWDIGHS